jgi:hypothetical protein
MSNRIMNMTTAPAHRTGHFGTMSGPKADAIARAGSTGCAFRDWSR